MPTDVNDIIKQLPSARRKRIEHRAGQLVEEEMTRQQLRVALKRTQVEVARALGINQDSVSRLEQRADILLSTLRKYVKALGGDLSLIVEFPNHAPVRLGGIAEQDERAAFSLKTIKPKSKRLAKVYV